jgi:hypothetical protein
VSIESASIPLPVSEPPIAQIADDLGEKITLPQDNAQSVASQSVASQSVASPSVASQGSLFASRNADDAARSAEDAALRDATPRSPSGEIFDPSLHVSPDSINKRTGLFRRKKGAPKPEGNLNSGNVNQLNCQQLATIKQQTENAGVVLSGLFFGVGCMFLSSDFAPKNAEEKKAVHDSIVNYLASSGISDIPPGMALAITLCGYTAGKFAAEENVRKSWKEKVMGPIKKIFGKK